jgi:hypothetical protein
MTSKGVSDNRRDDAVEYEAGIQENGGGGYGDACACSTIKVLTAILRIAPCGHPTVVDYEKGLRGNFTAASCALSRNYTVSKIPKCQNVF